MLKVFLIVAAITSPFCISSCVSHKSGGVLAYDIAQFENYALASNGAAVEASSSTQAHPPELAINGVRDSSRWYKGEGWESVFSLRVGFERNWNKFWTKHYWSAEDELNPEFTWLTANFSAWLKITLPAPKKINRVVVHAYYSIDRVRYGLGDALIQVWDASQLAWRNVGRVNRGFISYPTQEKPKNGRYEFTFLPIETEYIRIFVTRGDSRSMKKHQHLETHWARIVEVEVTGGTLGASK